MIAQGDGKFGSLRLTPKFLQTEKKNIFGHSRLIRI